MYIIDFDGTLVDVWNRYYAVFNDFWDIKDFGLTEYKYYKQKYQFDDLIIRKIVGLVSNKDYLEYKCFKKEKLEELKYLMLDELIVSREWIKDFLLNQNSIILTIRNNRENLIKQLNYLNISFIADKVVTLKNKGIYTKNHWVKENIDIDEPKVIIGDSEIDFKIGLLDNTIVCLVETGLRNPINVINESSIKGKIISDIKRLNSDAIIDIWLIYNVFTWGEILIWKIIC